MLDLLLVIGALACFTVAQLYVEACDRLKAGGKRD